MIKSRSRISPTLQKRNSSILSTILSKEVSDADKYQFLINPVMSQDQGMKTMPGSAQSQERMARSEMKAKMNDADVDSGRMNSDGTLPRQQPNHKLRQLLDSIHQSSKKNPNEINLMY